MVVTMCVGGGSGSGGPVRGRLDTVGCGIAIVGNAHFKFWPNHALHHLDAPATNLFYNLEVSARRHPAKAALIYYDTVVTFPQLLEEVERLAGYLEQRCGVSKGDRVLLYMQNSPQFVIAYYAILRANAVVVPVNPMYLTQEFLRCAQDAGARCTIVAQELYPRIEPLVGGADLDQVILACYADYLKVPTDLNVPEFIKAPHLAVARAGVVAWSDALGADLRPGALTCGPDDLAVMPYTSGTTGEPKGCMHSHRTVMYTAVASMHWFALQPELTSLALAPFFHVTGMQGSMNGPIYNGNTVVLLPRWDRDVAARVGPALPRSPVGPPCQRSSRTSISIPTSSTTTCPRSASCMAAGRRCPRRWRSAFLIAELLTTRAMD